MKIFLGILIWCFLWIKTSYAIPAGVLVLGYEGILIGIPFVVSFLSVIFFYFRRFSWEILWALFVLSGLLYGYVVFITETYWWISYEWGIFLVVLGGMYFSKKYVFLRYFLLGCGIFGVYLGGIVFSDILRYQKIFYDFQTNISSDFFIENSKIEKNFLAIFVQKDVHKAYVVIGKGEELNHCTARGEYFVCTGGERELGKELSQKMYDVIQY